MILWARMHCMGIFCKTKQNKLTKRAREWECNIRTGGLFSRERVGAWAGLCTLLLLWLDSHKVSCDIKVLAQGLWTCPVSITYTHKKMHNSKHYKWRVHKCHNICCSCVTHSTHSETKKWFKCPHALSQISLWYLFLISIIQKSLALGV